MEIYENNSRNDDYRRPVQRKTMTVREGPGMDVSAYRP